MFKSILKLFAVVSLLLIGSAAAQQPANLGAPILCGFTTLAVTGSTARIILPTGSTSCNALTISNDSTQEAFFKLGDVTVVAAVTDIPLPGGKSITIWLNPANTYIAAITATSTTTLRALLGTGPVPYL